MTALQKELAELNDEFAAKKAQWDNEKKTVEKVQKLREELESLKKEIALAKQNYDLEKAAELQYGRLPQLEGELAAEEEKVKKKIFHWCTKVLPMKRLQGSSPAGQEFR